MLVLYSFNRLLPGNVAADGGLRAALANTPDTAVFSEFLDQPYFSGPAHEETVTRYLREKYAAAPPRAIVVGSDQALDFVLRHRAELFPDAALVHMGVSQSHLRSLKSMPVDAVGIPLEYDLSGTIEQALLWHPNAQRLLLITGASEQDRIWEARLRREVPLVAGRMPVEYLAGLPTALVLKRVSELRSDTVVFTTGYFEDGEGRLFAPRDAGAAIAAASTAPVYAAAVTFIGSGVVGGRSPSFEEIGRQAGLIVKELFAGNAPASLRLPEIMPTALYVDWRQVQRWGIDEMKIPADAVVHFREPTLWEAYRGAVIGAVVSILLLIALVGALIFERDRRRVAELAVQGQRTLLAHASRLAVAGELTASIAHEINQPLGAILTNADAADLILRSGADRREDVLRILADIRRDDLRASDVIRKLRALLAKQEVERKPFDVNDAVNNVASLLRADADRRRVTLDVRPAASALSVIGDTIQIQQVLINLVLNAMDAVADVTDDRRAITVSVEKADDTIHISVRDRGHGISPDVLPQLFDSFFSTKHRGMGIGLSIARTIVEAHGGRIWAENGSGNGAVFRIELPASGAHKHPGRSKR